MTTTDPIIRRSSSVDASRRLPRFALSRFVLSREQSNAPSTRDRALDLVRSVSLVVVVLLHGMMAGISVGPSRQVVVTNALEDQPWFIPLSWLVQVMPLFFIVGGFAGLSQWRRVQARGGSAVEFVRSRLERLARPAIVVFGTIAGGLVVASIAGVSPDLLAQLGFRMAQPLWFLAVYLGVSSLVPVFAAAHDRAPHRSIITLAGAALLVDILRTATGIEGLGYLNLGFVWLAVQQLGFWWANGAFTRCSPARAVGGIVGSLTALLVLWLVGLSSPDMYDALNPPTSALILLGLAQTFALGVLHPRLTAAAADPQVRRMVEAVGSRSMTIYLWHMPVLVIIAAVLLFSGVVWPEPLSGPWWLTRGVWLGTILVTLVPVASIMGRFERRSAGGSPGPTPSPTRRPGIRTATAVVLAIAGVLGVLIGGFTVLTAVTGTLLLSVAVRLVGSRREIRSTGSPSSTPSSSPSSTPSNRPSNSSPDQPVGTTRVSTRRPGWLHRRDSATPQRERRGLIRTPR
ncbi:acyltransferase family protein [Plantibacter sp. YIM 135347]|uniref:acyltransferase family protein n=1 Tax=Plantibacter sp. YIM 135347 TaxID=3423919 RepID=UPI003D325503